MPFLRTSTSASTFATPRRLPHTRASSTSLSSTDRSTMDFTRQAGLARLPISLVTKRTSFMLLPLLVLQDPGRGTEAQHLLAGYLLRHELKIPVRYEVQLRFLHPCNEAVCKLGQLFGFLQKRVSGVHNPCE